MTLYSYTDDVKTRFYILEAEGKVPQELRRLVYNNPDVPQQIVEDFRYRNTMQMLFSRYNVDAAKQTMLRDLSYRQSDFLRAVSLINRSELVAVRDKSISFFGGIALNSYKSDYVAEYSSSFPKQSLQSSVAPMLTIGANLYLNPVYQKCLFVSLPISFTINSITKLSAAGLLTTIVFSSIIVFYLWLLPTI